MSLTVQKPNEATVKRMTVQSVKTLLSTLKEQRAAYVRPYDEQIKIYEDILEQKEKELANAKTTR